MRTLRRLAVALLVGCALLGVAALISLVLGDPGDWFFRVSAIIGSVGLLAGGVMSGSLFFGTSYASRAATVAPPTAPGSPDPNNEGSSSRLNSVYPVVAVLPCLAIAVVHYLL